MAYAGPESLSELAHEVIDEADRLGLMLSPDVADQLWLTGLRPPDLRFCGHSQAVLLPILLPASILEAGRSTDMKGYVARKGDRWGTGRKVIGYSVLAAIACLPLARRGQEKGSPSPVELRSDGELRDHAPVPAAQGAEGGRVARWCVVRRREILPVASRAGFLLGGRGSRSGSGGAPHRGTGWRCARRGRGRPPGALSRWGDRPAQKLSARSVATTGCRPASAGRRARSNAAVQSQQGLGQPRTVAHARVFLLVAAVRQP